MYKTLLQFVVLFFLSSIVSGQRASSILKKKDIGIINNSAIALKDNNGSVISRDFIDSLEDIQIIGLGESSHGTKEIFETKSSLIKDLILNETFRLLAFEAPYSELIYIDQYVKSSSIAKTDSVLQYFTYWTWMTDEVLELLNWIKDYNEETNDPVSVIGIDVTSYTGILTRLVDLADTVNNDHLSSGLKKMAKKLDYITKTRYSKKSILLPYYDVAQLKIDLDSLKEQIINHTKEKSLSYDLDFEWINLNYYIDNIFRRHYLLRDELMSQNVKAIYKKKRKKMVIWAHNHHLDKSPTTKRMGSYLAHFYGKQYQNIAITFEHGTYSAHSDNGERIHQALPNPKESIEAVLSQNEKPSIIVNILELSSKNKRINQFLKNTKMKLIGVVKPKKEFYDYNLLESYNYLIRVKKSTPSNIL